MLTHATAAVVRDNHLAGYLKPLQRLDGLGDAAPTVRASLRQGMTTDTIEVCGSLAERRGAHGTERVDCMEHHLVEKVSGGYSTTSVYSSTGLPA
jgi:hypothetical protein